MPNPPPPQRKHVGFTGTRRGMTEAQASSVYGWLLEQPGPVTFHHGDCVGADVKANNLAALAYARLVVHPPVDATYRAGVAGYSEIREPKTHFARNRDIVDESDVLIATPWQTTRPAPKTGGGTWYTVEYAEKRGKRVVIIWPDGTIQDSAHARKEKNER